MTKQHTGSAKQLDDAQTLRYCRHILLPQIDFAGQEALLNAKILIVGLGGLGSSCVPYLASSGVGQLTLVDFDTIEVTNLQRQVIYQESQLQQNKALAAKAFIAGLNSQCQVNAIARKLTDDEREEFVKSHDVVIDCTDNLTIRQQLNQSCFNHKTPLVSGAAIRFEGQVTSFNYAPNTPCYSCYAQGFGEQQLSCVEAGIFAPVVGVVGAMQALEALKIITAVGEPLFGILLFIDGLTSQQQQFYYHHDKNCPVCG
ncbi:molybdopterin-synthase adenylyltransferase MoeB [Pseudoalteromonas prydzensis]|uniref:molybdopterin-synthase adenylyltransferase MoeB n=1 Tax=Pseudoalteromonas prydzensis TaxID=182141 RepID=UPI0024BCAE35|nr:molybdopterin-synthase adenylyltransferase MoeB [Pseudoalteromonas prydzensis]